MLQLVYTGLEVDFYWKLSPMDIHFESQKSIEQYPVLSSKKMVFSMFCNLELEIPTTIN